MKKHKHKFLKFWIKFVKRDFGKTIKSTGIECTVCKKRIITNIYYWENATKENVSKLEDKLRGEIKTYE